MAIVLAGCSAPDGAFTSSSRLSLSTNDTALEATAECADGVVWGEVTSSGAPAEVTITLEDDASAVLGVIENKDFDRGGQDKVASYSIPAPAGLSTFRLCFVQGNGQPRKTCVGVVCRGDEPDAGAPPDDDGGSPGDPDAGTPDAGSTVPGSPDAGANPPEQQDGASPTSGESLSCLPAAGGCAQTGACPAGLACSCEACGDDGAPACCLTVEPDDRAGDRHRCHDGQRHARERRPGRERRHRHHRDHGGFFDWGR